MRRGKIGGSKASIEGSPSLPSPFVLSFSISSPPSFALLVALLRFYEGKALARLPRHRHTQRVEASFNYKNPVVLCSLIFTASLHRMLPASPRAPLINLNPSRIHDTRVIKLYCFFTIIFPLDLCFAFSYHWRFIIIQYEYTFYCVLYVQQKNLYIPRNDRSDSLISAYFLVF